MYCADHTYTTLKTTMDTKAEIIRNQAAEKLNLDNGIDYSLVELKSDNGRKFNLNLNILPFLIYYRTIYL